MGHASQAWVIRDRRAPTDLATRCHGKDGGYRLLVLQNMQCANILCGEDRDERRRSGRLLDILSALGLLSFNQAHHAYDLEPEFARRLDSLHSRGAGSANVIDDHDSSAFYTKAFNALSCAVLFLAFPNQKSIQLAADH